MQTPSSMILAAAISDIQTAIEDDTITVEMTVDRIEKIVADAMTATMTVDVFDEVYNERVKQDRKWGDEHDDEHGQLAWPGMIVVYLGRAVQWPFKGKRFRRNMIKAAALCVAGVEWYDRNKDDIKERMKTEEAAIEEARLFRTQHGSD